MAATSAGDVVTPNWLLPSTIPPDSTCRACPHPAPKPALTWKGCLEGLQCATLAVPLDHRRPELGTIAVALARKPATRPKERIGSLLVNPGGPGASGITYLISFATNAGATGAVLNQRFDLVSFDPRGVGASRQVKCLDDELSASSSAGCSRTREPLPNSTG